MEPVSRSVEVTSPVEGTVISVEHQLGWHVQAGDVVATVVSGDTTVAMRAGAAGIVRQIRTEAGARLMGKPSLAVGANRCVRCSHLELFAIGPDETRAR
jgi:acetyl/propionyl-CoA carboxylase alpha subunit